PVTGNVNRTAGPVLRICTDCPPGGVASGTMPFFSSAAAMPGAVVTAVVPPRRCTAAAARVPLGCAVAADAAVAAEPASRLVTAVAAARYLNPRMSSPSAPLPRDLSRLRREFVQERV